MTNTSYEKIGGILAAARTDQKKNLKDIAQAIKIQLKYLEAVEAGDPGELPSEAYFMLFARSYGQHLGIDSRIFEEISADIGSGPDAKSSGGSGDDIDHHRRQGQITIKRIIWLVIAAIVIFVGLLLVNAYWLKSDSPENSQQVVEEVTHPEQPVNQEQTDAALDFDVTPYQQPDPLRLRMEALQDVWVIVVRDGDTVLHRQLLSGDVRQWEAKYRYELTLGISTGVKLTVNDVDLAPLSDRARTISGLEINQVNFKQFYPADDVNDQAPDTVSNESAPGDGGG